jgi:hypothetical protein
LGVDCGAISSDKEKKMDEGTGIVLQIMLLILIAALWFATRTQKMRMEMRQAGYPLKPSFVPQQPKASVLPGTETAMAKPPSDLRIAMSFIARIAEPESYTMPIGWQLDDDGKPYCVCAPLRGDTYHTLITGQSRAGKDNLALNAMLGLALTYPPEKVQFCIIDGKGLDFCGFEGKAHTWLLALEPKEIAPALDSLTRERERRGKLLREALVSKWENYKEGDLPLLVIYVSELSLLEGAVGKRQLTDWLNQELAAGAAFGIRYIIATQTASNFDTRWRSQISLYLAAFQPSQSQDQPNTGLTTNEIKKGGGVPPSELPPPPNGAGVFTCIQGREAVTVRAGLMDDEQRKTLLERLPVKVEPVDEHTGILDELLMSTVKGHNGNGNGHTSMSGIAHTEAQYHPTATIPDTTVDTTEEELSDKEIQRLYHEEEWSKNRIAAKLRGSKQARLDRIDNALRKKTG